MARAARLRKPASRGEALGAFERALARISPTWALRRAAARLALRQYEAAGVSRRTEGWTRTLSSSPNSVLRSGLDRLRARSRQMVENVGWAASAVGEIEAEVIGTGIRAQIYERPDLNRAAAKRLEGVWKSWAESTECDAEGRHDFYGLQALAMRSIAESGEVLIRRRWRKRSDGLTVPLQLQILEADHLDTLREDLAPTSGAGPTIQGIEYSPIGKPQRYFLYPNHPGDNYRATLQSKPVAARDILHPFRTLRPGQARGIPWGAPALLAMRDFADYTDATRLRAKIANAFVGFVKDISPDMDQPIVGGMPPSSLEPTILNSDLRDFEPGSWEVLPDGKTIEFSNPPAPDQFDAVSKVNLLEIAAGYEVPFERLTGDYRGMPFSASRMSELRFMRRVDGWRWRTFIPQVAQGVMRWFLEAAELVGEWNGPPNLVPVWTPQRRELIEPGKETEAMKKRVRCGFTSHAEELRGLGFDAREVYQQIAEERALFDSLGLVFDSDPRQDTRRLSLEEGDGEDGSSSSTPDDADEPVAAGA